MNGRRQAKLAVAGLLFVGAGFVSGQTAVPSAPAQSVPAQAAVPQAAPTASPAVPQTAPAVSAAPPAAPQQAAPVKPQPQPPLERAFGGPKMQGRWWKNPRAIENLSLTAEQQKAMDGILMEYRETLIDLHAGLQKAELRFEEQIDNEPPNENGILLQIDRVAQARAELEKANARYLLAIWNKLTLEQRSHMKEIRQHGWPRPNRGFGMQKRQGERPESGVPLLAPAK